MEDFTDNQETEQPGTGLPPELETYLVSIDFHAIVPVQAVSAEDAEGIVKLFDCDEVVECVRSSTIVHVELQ